jgi:hypothetical protein
VSIITLLTDFGTADHFAGAMKGVILSINPKAVIVDITHEIPPQDIAAGAFTLLAAHSNFPTGTIHVAVVDPGVGSTRRPIVVSAGDHLFVGPDNGLFTYLYMRYVNHDYKIFHLTASQYFRESVSNTFHGRDIFAPVAAALSNGVKPSSLGEQIRGGQIRLPVREEPTIIHIDHFGNLITDIADRAFPKGVSLAVNGRAITTFRRFYGEAIGAADEPFVIAGSAGLLEIAVNGGSAARVLGVKRGDPVEILT